MVVGQQGPLSYVVHTAGVEVPYQIGEVGGDPGNVLSEEELIPHVDQPIELRTSIRNGGHQRVPSF